LFSCVHKQDDVLQFPLLTREKIVYNHRQGDPKMRLPRPILALMVALAALIALPDFPFAQEKSLVGARHPAVSPDGKQIAFSYMGDIWAVPAEGGRAFRLTDHTAYEREPIWSPDGQWLAFTSNRFGNNDVFLMKAMGGIPRQLTFHTGDDTATDFSPDGQWVIFRTGRASSSSLYKVPVAGGTELPVLETYWNWAFHGRLSPDGRAAVFSQGTENSYWWRTGYRGANTAKLWVADLAAGGGVRKVFADTANAFWPDWGADGSRIYFVSDRGTGVYNIWSVTAAGTDPKAVTSFAQGDVRFMSVAARSPLAAYEREYGIWLTDLRTGSSRRIPIEAPAETKDNRTFIIENAPVSEFKLSPDGKKIAAVVRGEIFVLGSDGGYARNVTRSPWREKGVDWDKDSRNIVYVSDVGANPDLFIVSALGDASPRRLTSSPGDENSPGFSPDGKWIAYFRGQRELRLIRPDGQGDRLLAEEDFGGRFADRFAWSPDGAYVAASSRRNANMDLLAFEVATGKKIALTNTAYDETGPVWARAGKSILFLSNRSGHSFPEFTGQSDIYQLFLEPRKAEFDEDTFDKLFAKEEVKEKPDPKKDESVPAVALRLEDIDRQTEIVAETLGIEREFVILPKDESAIFVSNMDSDKDGRSHMWKVVLKGTARGRFEPFLPSALGPASLQLDPKGEALFYLSQGRISRVEIASVRQKGISFDTKISVDKTSDYEQMLGELYYTLQHYYYDETHHKTDWKAVYEEHRPVLQQVREDQDFADYANEMIGRLNSSHMGFSMPRAGRIDEPSAHVGAVWSFAGGKAVLSRIIKDGPLYDRRDAVAAGDELLAVDGIPLDPTRNFWTYFNGKLEKRLRLSFRNPKTEKTSEISLRAVSSGEENRLLLEEWVASRREAVKAKTGDQVAYIYMRAMGMGDLTRFLLELERDAVPRRGLILDLRFNNGGNVHDRVLEALMKPKYAKWRVRGMSETPQSSFGFADKPVVLITNEVTLSDGEMTTNGFQALKRGPVVGNTTYGWLIFTTSAGLMNGGGFRLPYWGCYTLDGRDIETMGGIKPDIMVASDLGDELAGRDPQLDRAVAKALELVGAKK
jgi:tricorn protease